MMTKIATAFLLAAFAFTPWVARADDGALEEAMIEMMTGPKQHAALAEHYRTQAEDARAKVKLHQRMKKTYHGGSTPQRKKLGDHCQKLADHYSSVAKEYDDLVALHTQE